LDAVLKPRQTEVTVLFCDLRGSCKIAEDAEQDLAATCDRVADALTVMTTNIIKMDGVVGDFQGDAAMGFWGWPLASEDQVEKACRAALGIYHDFLRESKRAGRHAGPPRPRLRGGAGGVPGRPLGRRPAPPGPAARRRADRGAARIHDEAPGPAAGGVEGDPGDGEQVSDRTPRILFVCVENS